MAQLLVIEDELVLAKNIARYFERQGHTVAVVHDGEAGLQTACELRPDVVIVDFQLPGLNGLEVIRELRRLDDEIRIVMITGHGTINIAVEAMKAGSMDLLTKPLSLASLDEVVQRAVRERAGRSMLRYYQQRDHQHSSVQSLIGECPQMHALREMIQAVAASEPSDNSPAPPVLVQGETGTGKELVARACHLASPRSGGPFIEVNCAALPANLMEDELFGHEKGAFTDARARKVGLIEAADGGTLFLDEIGELELSLQAKLLRVLENYKVRPIGSVHDRKINVRIVAATNRDLAAEARAGRFRSDLVYRLSVFQVRIPPLRERGDDVLMLAHEFLQRLGTRYGRPPMKLEGATAAALCTYPWPGNVRELRNCLERAVLMQRGPVLLPEDLGLLASAEALMPASAIQAPPPGPIATRAPGVVPLDSVEREHLLQALETHGWNVSLAARALQVTRDTLRYRMAKHGLTRQPR
ncbi:sigma-54 dependent transcriptional regulator [Ramlibacter monticola]|uniref:Sigma-54-dependent Fis family transcriptional regulator n=1 Tax=Ramlibacter monticola TaxID=1926872 RepID=A0A936YY30_9BURK|nr:sigma-54 dependent transcriptional regulator [Ramlibacter monticola]MBL0390726.1 sigma-54-dependent Fis family transcriptional regulator [Ramlibacter monticola]